MLCFFTGILPLRLLYWSAILLTGESINFLATCVFREKIAIYNFMSFERDAQVWNHSVLISSPSMEFGHRNFVVVVGCPNSGKRLNKWVTK